MKGFIFHQVKICRTSLSEMFFTRVISKFLECSQKNARYGDRFKPCYTCNAIEITFHNGNFPGILQELKKTIFITKNTCEGLLLGLKSHADPSVAGV